MIKNGLKGSDGVLLGNILAHGRDSTAGLPNLNLKKTVYGGETRYVTTHRMHF